MSDLANLATLNVTRIPFYHVFKTIFLLYLALPQTRGASYVYSVHLHPLIAKHEVEIDAALGRVKEEVWRWVMLRIRGLWEHIASGEGARETPGDAVGARSERPEAAVPAGPTQLAYALWQTYSPALAGLLRAPSTPPSQSPFPLHVPSQPQPPAFSRPMTQFPYSHAQGQSQPKDPPARGTTSAIDMHPDAALLARRRALEAELSALPLPNPHDSPPAFPVSQPGTSTFPANLSSISRPGSSTYLPASDDERGRYEEIGREDIESDTEGKGFGDERGSMGPSGGSWASWWWGGGSRGDGYERVKTE